MFAIGSGTLLPPDPGNNLLSNPGFDDAGGSLNSWSVFGNTTSNVSANGQLANDGTHAMKIFGQFSGSSNLSGASQGVAISEGDSLRAEASTITPSWDTLFGKNNHVTMKIEFFSVYGAAAGSGDYLGEVSQLIHDGCMILAIRAVGIGHQDRDGNVRI